jgi:hypothetical protein
MVSEMNWQIAWMRGRSNPLLFVTDVLGAKPEPWQAEALEAVGRHDRVSIRSGHGVGKTTLQAWLVLWFPLTRQNCKVPVAANSQDQLRDTIWPEIAKWHRQLPEALSARNSACRYEASMWARRPHRGRIACACVTSCGSKAANGSKTGRVLCLRTRP